MVTRPFVFVACCVALAGGCSRPSAPSRVLVASVRQPATSLFFVAKGSGCFDRERLMVDEWSFELGRDALELLRDGTADAAVAYETPVLRAALVDDRLRVLTKLHTSVANTRLVTRTQAGVRTFSDLAGKRVAVARGTNADFFAEVALAAGGLERGAAKAVDLAPSDAVAALARGEIDAAVLSDPYAAEAEGRLGTGARTLRTELYSEASLLVTRADVLAVREPSLRALVRGLVCAERYAHDHAEEARALVRERFPAQSPARLAAQLGRVTWGVGLDNVLVDVLRRERDWLLASQPGAATADLRDLLDARLLDAAAPESVTLLPGTGGLRW